MKKHKNGIVYLVGGGPGDPGLITVRGLECLRQAEVVVHDRLVSRFLLRFAPSAEWIDVGKQPDHHPVPQEKINQLLVEKALEGKVVVRLKGGDPFVFGRGGEEAAALAERGLPFEVVPGITSAIAAPAYAGIPITNRGQACSAVIITGHRAENCDEDPADNWRRAAQGADTLVFLMGVLNLAQIVKQALEAGREPGTPVAIIQRGSTLSQKTTTGTLETIVEQAKGVRPPAIIIIGEVVTNREKIRWFDLPTQRPLLGIRVLNTRPVFHACLPDPLSPFGFDEFSQLLISHGAEPVELPLYRQIPAPFPERFLFDAKRSQPEKAALPFDWIIFTSQRSVSVFSESLLLAGCDFRWLSGLKLAVAGEPARDALRQKGLVADRVLDNWRQAADLFAGSRILLPVVDRSCDGLPEDLGISAEQVEAVSLVQNQKLEPDEKTLDDLNSGKIDIAAFFSPEDFLAVLEQTEQMGATGVLREVPIACADLETVYQVEKAGLKACIIAENSSVEAVVEAICRWYRRW